jgi:hypothetical protein
VGLWAWAAADVHVITQTGAARALGTVAADLRLLAARRPVPPPRPVLPLLIAC